MSVWQRDFLKAHAVIEVVTGVPVAVSLTRSAAADSMVAPDLRAWIGETFASQGFSIVRILGAATSPRPTGHGSGSRSLIETAFRVRKSLAGPVLRALSPIGQLREAWCRRNLRAIWILAGNPGVEEPSRAATARAAHAGRVFASASTLQRLTVGRWPCGERSTWRILVGKCGGIDRVERKQNDQAAARGRARRARRLSLDSIQTPRIYCGARYCLLLFRGFIG